MDNYVGKICPFCKTAITEADTVTVCPACGIAHHTDCWNENHGCATFGCSQQNAAAGFCAACGAPMGGGQAFCGKCGMPRAVPQRNVCGKCGSQLQAGQQFCNLCGQPVGLTVEQGVASAIDQFNAQIQQKKKRKPRLPVILGVVGAILGVIALIVFLTRPKVERIKVDQSDVELRVGETIKVEYDISPNSASDVEVEWSTSDDDVATVKKGVITAEGEGSCTVKVRAGGKTAKVRVEVYELKAAERDAVGVYTTVAYVKDDDVDWLPSSFATFTLRSDLTGELELDDSTLEFTWWLSKSEDGDHYFQMETEDGREDDFFISDDTLYFFVGDYTLVFE